MKRLIIVVLLLAAALSARAQVIIINDGAFVGRLSEITATVVDSLTNEPVPFASVYVIPAKDTTITNFTLSDAEGKFRLDEVPYGNYSFHVEMLGYKPWVIKRYFRDRRVNLGTIKMQVDENFISAAVVTDVGNPIVIKQDTVEFNASSYRVGANAMLIDLLRRMPGMEITDEGKVKFNGETIDKLTVGGRTFFFGDQATALNNLPASIVDKVRVIDRESERTRSTGFQTGQREKVLDVGLKKEYEKGWFGNVGLKGGSTLVPKDDDPLKDDRGLLFSTNALASAYTEQDQVTFVANGQNVSDSNITVRMFDATGGGMTGISGGMGGGIATTAQAGVNYNTSRIKDVETTAAVNYRYGNSDTGHRSARTTFETDGDLLSDSQAASNSISNSLGTNVEFRKEKGKVYFLADAGLSYDKSNTSGTNSSDTRRDGVTLNESSGITSGNNNNLGTNVHSSVSLRELGGKKNRSIRFTLSGSALQTRGNSTENTVLKTFTGKEDIRALTYINKGSSLGVTGGISYTEPIGDKVMLAATATLDYSHSLSQSDASDASGHNDYYSSESDNNSMVQDYELTAQYKWKDRTWLTLGASLTGQLNETYSKSYGVSTITGKDDWKWFVMPRIRFQHGNGINHFSIGASGHAQQPSQRLMLPVPDVSNPSRISLGNIYLKPSGYTSLNADWSRNDRAKFSTLMVYLVCGLQVNPVSNALWYDSNGIMYSVPVNTKRPTVSTSLSVYWTMHLDEAKNLSLSVNGGGSYSTEGNYQAKGSIKGIDTDSFDYGAFMDSFWGDSSGDRFYSSQSGFYESITNSISPNAGVSVKYNRDHYYFTVSANASARLARYSLNPTANMNTLDASVKANGSYTTKHEFEFNSNIAYLHRFGYAEGYGDPEWQWNASASKNVGAFNLSFRVHDILNQTRTISHTVTANYMEDTWQLAIGRYFLFGVKWNFGKMNASHSRNATRAALGF